MVIPGQGFPTEDGRSTTEDSSTKPTTATILSPINFNPQRTAHLSPGAIAGIAIASLIVALILFGIIFLLGLHSRILQNLHHHRQPSFQKTNRKISAEDKLDNKYSNKTLVPPLSGEICYWTSSAPAAPAPAPPAPNYKPSTYRYRPPTDLQSSPASIPSPPPPLGWMKCMNYPHPSQRSEGGSISIGQRMMRVYPHLQSRAPLL